MNATYVQIYRVNFVPKIRHVIIKYANEIYKEKTENKTKQLRFDVCVCLRNCELDSKLYTECVTLPVFLGLNQIQKYETFS